MLTYFAIYVDILFLACFSIKGGSKNYHCRYILRVGYNVLPSFALFLVQSVGSLGHNARIAPSLTCTLTSKIESKSVKANLLLSGKTQMSIEYLSEAP